MLKRSAGNELVELKKQYQQLKNDRDRLKEEVITLREWVKGDAMERYLQESHVHLDVLGPDRIPWTKFYDAVLYVRQFPDLWGKRGWPIKSTHHAKRLSDWTMPVVTVFGDFGKGKTFTLNMLSGANLPSGKHIDTKGLSFKHHILDQREVLLLDQQGADAPIVELSEQTLVQRKAEERFLQDVTYDISDVFIFVVNRITCAEQCRLLDLCRAVQIQKPNKKVIILHNLREYRTRHDMERGLNEVSSLYPNLSRCRQEIECDGQRRVVTYLEGRSFQHLATSQSHYFVGKAGTTGGELNDWVYKKIRSIVLDGCDRKEGTTLDQRLKNSFMKHLPKYVDGPSQGNLTIVIEGDENLSDEGPVVVSEVNAEEPCSPLECETVACSSRSLPPLGVDNDSHTDWDDSPLLANIRQTCDASTIGSWKSNTKKSFRTAPTELESMSMLDPDIGLWMAPVKKTNITVSSTMSDSMERASTHPSSVCSEDSIQLIKSEVFRLVGPADQFHVKASIPSAGIAASLFGDSFTTAVPTDIYECDNGDIVIKMEFAGISKQNITVKGQRHPPLIKIGIVLDATNVTYSKMIQQQRTNKCSQEIPVPEGYDVGTLKKQYQDGLLTIAISKFVEETVDVDWS